MAEFSKDILRLGQLWERADGKTVTVVGIESDFAKFVAAKENFSLRYFYADGGKSSIHRFNAGSELVRILDDGEPENAPVGSSIQGDTTFTEEDPIVLEQEVIVNTALSNLIGNYPSIGYAVVRIAGLQIEVDFEEHSLTIQDNPNPHDAFSNS